MSLDDFFNKKSKKKSKRTINTNELYEKIIDNGPITKPEAEKINEELLPTVTNDDEWEPINNEMIPDFEDLDIRDLEDEEEYEDTSSNNAKDASKSNSHEVAWKNKPKPDAEPKNKEVTEPQKPSVFVPRALRKAQDLPNVDSMDEFPTLDAVKDMPAKKVVKTVEPVDNSWTDVTRGSNKRKEETSNPYVPPSLNRGRYVPPGLRDGGNGLPQTRSYASSERSSFSSQPTSVSSSSSSWTRGNTNKKDDVVRTPTSTGSERKSGVIPAARPYVPPSMRNANPITQSNRFAQLDSS